MSREELWEAYTSLKDTVAQQKKELAALQKQLESEQRKNDKLNNMLFATRSEKYITQAIISPLQTRLFEPLPIPEVAVPGKSASKVPARKRGGRKEIPENLPEEREDVYPNIDRTKYKYIGSEKRVQVVHRSASVIKKVTIIHKFKDLESGAIISGEYPKDAFPKCIAHSSLIAWILVAKHVDHLPLHRIIQKFEREYGWKVSKATMQSWIKQASDKLNPLMACLRTLIQYADYLQADESGIRVQVRREKNRKKWKMHKGQMWVYHDPIQRLVLFDYQYGRAKKHALEILQNFKGKLQTDAYGVYDSIAAAFASIVLVACLTHVRRKFHEALANDKVNAEKVLLYIQQLYDIEAECREAQLSYEQRRAKRQEESTPIMIKLKELLDALLDHTLPDEPIGKAVRHALKRWDYLQEYIHDGRLEICNNLVENIIRSLALGRKNYLFAGSEAGAQRLAMYHSLFATCRQNDVNPLEWLQDVLERIDDHSIQRLQELLPPHWKAARTQQATDQ